MTDWKTFLLAAAVCLNPAGAPVAETRAPDDSAAEKNSGSEDFQTLDSLFSLYQPYLEDISAYRPMYFLAGTDPEESKFQISLKYRFFTPGTEIAEEYPWSKNFYLAYTQASLWDLEAASQPFKDTSYKPELFFLSPGIYSGGPGISRLFVQTGYRHESNGRGDQYSRSTNYAYIRPIFIFYDQRSRLGIQVAPSAWAYLGNDDDTNPDLHRYRGYFDLGIKVGRADALVLESHIRWAAEGGSVQLDATYPLDRVLPAGIDIYLHAQYVNTLAESLLDYRERTRALRLGISIVR